MLKVSFLRINITTYIYTPFKGMANNNTWASCIVNSLWKILFGEMYYEFSLKIHLWWNTVLLSHIFLTKDNFKDTWRKFSFEILFEFFRTSFYNKCFLNFKANVYIYLLYLNLNIWTHFTPKFLSTVKLHLCLFVLDWVLIKHSIFSFN